MTEQKRPYLVGIVGGSGSGKTTLIKTIAKDFDTTKVCVLSLDNYYHPREHQEADGMGFKNFDRPESIDREAFYADVQRLLNWETITREEYTFNNSKAEAKELHFEPAPIIILEGLFIFHYEEIRNLLDLKLFMHAQAHLSIIRRIKRDGFERNYPVDDVVHRFEHHVQPAYENYIAPYKEDADLVINNNSNFDAAYKVIYGFFYSQLLTS